MVNLAKVYLWGEYVGAVHWNEKVGAAAFEYAPSFIEKGIELSPIMMPISRAGVFTFTELSRDTFLGLPGLLADALPDAYGKALLDRWLSSIGRTFANPVERLCYQGKRSMGALEFEPAQDVFLDQSNAVEMQSLVRIANEVLNQKAEFSANLSVDAKEALASIIRVSTSAGGQRAKAVIAYNETTGDVLSGQVDAPEGFSQWLIKLDGVTNKSLGDPQHYGVIEYIYYLMAKNAGIEMTQCRLFNENNRSHFMTKRFDRVNGNEKIHMQTLCGIAHYDYKMLHAYSYEQAFQVMRQLHLPYHDAEQLFRRMVFNVMARNRDDHTKNISFIMDKEGVWSLSPAYDMSFCYNPRGEWTATHQMSINNKWDDIVLSDLISVATSMHIKNAKEIIEQVKHAVSEWNVLGMEYELPKERIKYIDSLLLYNSL